MSRALVISVDAPRLRMIDPVGDLEHLRCVLLGDQDAQPAACPDLGDRLEEEVDVQGGEAGRGLVEEEDFAAPASAPLPAATIRDSPPLSVLAELVTNLRSREPGTSSNTSSMRSFVGATLPTMPADVEVLDHRQIARTRTRSWGTYASPFAAVHPRAAGHPDRLPRRSRSSPAISGNSPGDRRRAASLLPAPLAPSTANTSSPTAKSMPLRIPRCRRTRS